MERDGGAAGRLHGDPGADRVVIHSRETGAPQHGEPPRHCDGEHLRDATSLAPHIAVLDRDGSIVAINDQWQQFAGAQGGVPSATGVGANYIEVCRRAAASGSEEAAVALAGIQAVLDGSRPEFTLEYPCHAPGEERWFLLYATPLPRGAVVSHLNVTECKRAEQSLTEAREAALDAARVKSEFLANMSHEIRTPMTAIIGMAEFALETDLSDEQREYLGTLKSASLSLLGLINDILDFSQLEAGRFALKAVPFVIREELVNTLRMLAVTADEKKLDLICDVHPNTPDVVVGDPGRLGQIVLNLVGNAIKFTEHGEIVVRASTETGDDGQLVVHFAISDTGIGIPADRLEAIFEAFNQADGSSTRRYGGTGLGLTIAQQLARMMGGKVWVDSVVGQGSTFHFTARVAAHPAVDDRMRQEDLTAAADRRVMVIEHNQTLRDVIVAMLEGWKMRPEAFADAAGALARLEQPDARSDPFALAIVDVQLGDGDGFGLGARLRQARAASSIGLAFLIASDEPDYASRCQEIGRAAYLRKPFASRDLLQTIGGVLADTPDRAALETSAEAAAQPVGPLRILLAEDEPVNRKIVVRLLERAGHQVVTAEDGRRALAILEQERFDVVLMDVQMPGLDGFAATAAIRKHEPRWGSHMPIIALTAHALLGDRERCIDAGMDDYVAKPISSRQLLGAIDRVVGRTQVARAASGAAGPVQQQVTAEGIRHFFDGIPSMIESIRQGLRRQDAEAVCRAAQWLNDACRKLAAEASAQATADAAVRLESLSRQGDLAAAQAAWSDLEAQVHRLEERLSASASG